jgi:tetrahydromethanopterin S-methyltransferase subunit G
LIVGGSYSGGDDVPNGFSWKQWVAQAALTALVAAAAAFGGIRTGLSEAQRDITAVRGEVAAVAGSQAASDRRLDRIEDKLDRVVERRP